MKLMKKWNRTDQHYVCINGREGELEVYYSVLFKSYVYFYELIVPTPTAHYSTCDSMTLALRRDQRGRCFIIEFVVMDIVEHFLNMNSTSYSL